MLRTNLFVLTARSNNSGLSQQQNIVVLCLPRNLQPSLIYLKWVVRSVCCSYCGSSRIKTCANACDHGLSFKSLSRATPCISSLNKRILSPVVENKNSSRAVSLFCFHIGEEYFYWPIKNNQPMRMQTRLAVM